MIAVATTLLLILVSIAFVGLRDILVAQNLGLTSLADGYNFALLIGLTFSSIFTSSLTAAFAPVYSEIAHEKNANTAWHKVEKSLFKFSIAYYAMAIIISLTIYTYFMRYSGIDFKWGMILLGLIPFFGFKSSIYYQILNLNGYRKTVAMQSFWLSVPTVLILVLHESNTEYLFDYICASIFFGYLLNFIVVYYFFGVLINCNDDVNPRRVENAEKKISKKIYGLFKSMVGGQLVAMTPTLSVSILALNNATGDLSSYNYAQKIVAVFLLVGNMFAINYIQPIFTNLVARREFVKLNILLHEYLKIGFLISISCSSIIYFFSAEITEIIFKHKNFDDTHVLGVSTMMKILVWQLPFVILNWILNQDLLAKSMHKYLTYNAIICALISLLNYFIFMKFFEISGLMISVVLSALISCIIAFAFSKLEFKNRGQ